MRIGSRLSVAALATVAIAAGVACETQTATQPAAIGLPLTESFVGTLQPGGDLFYSFSMSQNGVVALTLVSMTGASVPADALFPIGIGQPFGTSCTAGTDAAASPGASPQLKVSKVQGVYCARIADTNLRLGAAANFVLNITHPR